MQIPEWMTSMRQQVDSWAQQQRAALSVPPQMTGWPPWHWQLKLPWHEDKRRKQELQEEYRRRKEQIEGLCAALKVENLAELQDVLGAMVLAECVYKRPDSEVVRHVNIYKSDFGGQLVSLQRIQPSLEHVSHRYLLAEGGDTLFAAFSGTKHIKDYLTDANILQEALFHEDDVIDNTQEELDGSDGKVLGQGNLKPSGGSKDLSSVSTVKGKPGGRKPSVHRGFYARARGIPAEDIYRLAQKKNYKLVLCGHSLGGAVAVLATLAILKAFATPSVMKAGGKLQIKCITFSQPPVGNPGLRDYVHRKGWQQHFRSYCIPEDLVPRLLSPGYFQHYRSPVDVVAEVPLMEEENRTAAHSENGNAVDSDRMVLGLGPFSKYMWRLPRLAPIVGTPRRFRWLKGAQEQEKVFGGQESSSDSNTEVTPVDIEEEPDGGALTVVTSESETKVELPVGTEKAIVVSSTKDGKGGNPASWLTTRVPPLPSYVPFGELFILDSGSVEQLSASEFTQLTSVQTVVQELLDRFQSHTMRSYRQRFQRIYDSCMKDYSSSVGMDHLLHLPNFQQWFGVLGARVAELGSIYEPIILRTATALVPLGWTGLPGDKGSNPLIIDVQGFNLHHCSHVRAQVNGRWCSATVESKPTSPYSKQDLQQVQPKLQKMRVRIGPPVDKAPRKSSLPIETDAVEGSTVFNKLESFPNTLDILNMGRKEYSGNEVQGFGEVTLYCSTDFMSATHDVIARMRRVRLLGLEGAGKTSLYCALLGDEGRTLSSSDGGVLPDMDWREGVAGGISYVDAAGVNLQDLSNEAETLRRELSVSVGQFGKKLDLVILVHNLGHKIPQLHHVGEATTPRPALSLLLDEVHAAGIPLVLAITNKFAVSADRRFVAARTVMNTYHIPSKHSVVVNSCPHTVHGVASETLESLISAEEAALKGPVQPKVQSAAQRLLSGPMNLVPRPFRKREVVLPSEGVKKLTSLVHEVLSTKEEAASEELAKEQLALQTAEELVQAARENAKLGGQKSGPAAAAAVGAAFGAGLGVFVAIVVGAASALRKP
ncbi:hypothetical protein MPTK1_7g06310 [Marchantia polymorpha subsp. ruderalis]|uniref:Fungal lipase-type domain-containing protein n=2 Tax=Marchantia polymorpha TaxID=3197 RepID=A0AAF6BWQ4_MARPO|nr:hypothetical protein MARPO_0057s0040 [Marchantia polymorpha]BBN16438.1 hypothetical protein Mp_7g06310 [Marchantia polymorpha subsp. ruderalis]|eukprot:PTQ37403.1 hypothetical protein MARPO_0057s0040 [Marchantia polymorpha]